ncbi:MAG: ABC transporter ATP-binding protein [Bacteroidetes bacterium]|nr:ABC transporter ATP-binding protein [Bacteroidota bacterium]
MKPLRYLRKYFYKYRVRLLLGVLFVASSNLFAIFPAQQVRDAIDLIKERLGSLNDLEGEDRQMIIDQIGHEVLYFAFLVIGFAILRGIFMYLMRQTIIVMSRHIEYDLKNEIYNHYQKLDQGFYRANRTGDLMARISEDVSRVRMYTGPAIMYAINLVVTIVLVLTVMFTVNVRLTWLVILPLPFLSYLIFRVNNLIHHKSDKIQEQLSNLTSFAQEAFSGIRVIKSFAAEKENYTWFKKETEDYRVKQMDLAKVDAIFFPLMVFLTGLSAIITVYAGGMEVLAGRASIGNIAEFIMYVHLLTWPVTSLGYTTSLIQRAAASQQRINEFLKTKPNLNSEETGYQEFEECITFRNVSFTYPGKKIPALFNISLKIDKGSTFAILGNTGSGKTTLVQLLLRVMDPSGGELFIDQTPLPNVNLKVWKKRIGYVPQDVFLFSDTIAGNIAFGQIEKVAETNHKVINAAKMAAIHSNIEEFKEGYQTRVGERGITLSGGQKQRVAMARAFIKEPEILILDDCLSALDTKTEAQILENLETLKVGKTTIIVSHRASSVKAADHIIVLNQGEIMEQGTHQELIDKKGLYKEIFEKQTKDDLV